MQVFQGNLIAFSVDGDFILIALTHQENILRKSMADNNGAESCLPYKISLYRIKYKVPASSSSDKKNSISLKSAASAATKSGQMKLSGNKRNGDGQLVLSAPKPEPLTVSKKSREYEYVDIDRLYRILKETMRTYCPLRMPRMHEMHYMNVLSVLVGLSGTDFSRNLPHVGPTTMWSMLAEDTSIFEGLLRSYDPFKNQVEVQDACNLFASRYSF